MMKYQILFLLLSWSCLPSACTRMTNSNQTLAIECGDVSPAFAYTKLYAPDGKDINPDELEIFSIDKAYTLVSAPSSLTNKSCVRRQAGEKYFVRNKTKTFGGVIDSDHAAPTQILEVFTNPLDKAQLGCDTLVRSSGDRFILSLTDQDTLATDPFVRVGLSLSRGDELLHQWPDRTLATHMEYSLNPLALSTRDEYLLKAEIFNHRFGTGSTLRCTLRIDSSAVQVSLGDRIKTIVPYFGRNFHSVDPGYAVDFYVQSGYKDLEIDYCIKPLSYQDVARGIWAEESCDVTQSFLKDDSVALAEGLWMIRYRGVRGQLQGTWQTDYVLVDKTCFGDLTPDGIAEAQCTRMVGTIRFDGLRRNSLPLRLHTLNGSLLAKEGPSLSFSGFEQLVSISGDLSVDGFPTSTFQGLDGLEWIGGSLLLSHTDAPKFLMGKLKRIYGSFQISASFIQDFRGLDQLDRIGSLVLKDSSTFADSIPVGDSGMLLPIEAGYSFQGLGQLRQIDSGIRLEKVRFEDFSGLHLETVGGMAIDEAHIGSLKGLETIKTLPFLQINLCERLKDLQGLEQLTDMGTLVVTDNSQLQSLAGLGARTVKSVTIASNEHLADLAGIKLQTAESIEISSNAELPNIDELQGLEGANRITIIGNGALMNLKGLRNVKQVETLEIVGNGSALDVSGLQNLQTAKKVTLQAPHKETLPFTGLKALEDLTLYDLDIQNLDALTGLNIHSLYIKNAPKLQDISGLHHLQSMQVLKIESAPQLAQLKGLENLEALVTLEIVGTSIPDLDSLDKLRSLDALQLTGNDQLQSMKGLKASSLADVVISENPLLKSLDGLQGLRLARHVYIESNDVLDDLVGLSQLQTAADLKISKNNQLLTLNGLEQLSSADAIKISGNKTLQNIDGLGNLLKVRRLEFTKNPALKNLDGLVKLQNVVSLTVASGAVESIVLPNFAESKDGFTVRGNPLTVLHLPAFKKGKIQLDGLDKLQDVDLSSFEAGTLALSGKIGFVIPTFPPGVQVTK